MTLYTLFKYMDLGAQIEIYDQACNFIDKGVRDTIDLPDKLLKTRVNLFIPGIVTMIYLNMELV